MWQGFGLSKTLGMEGFPNGEAFRLGTDVPNVISPGCFSARPSASAASRKPVEDDQLHLAGRQDVSRLTLTLGKISAKDIFDNNAYANDPRTQFMNWALMANEAWDYPADSLGYETGFAAELNQPHWTARYGFFQMPRTSNGTAQDTHYLEAWGMVTEFERRFTMSDHPGAVRLLAYLNPRTWAATRRRSTAPSAPPTSKRRGPIAYKYGFGLNIEQEIIKNVGVFARLGWSDGQTEAWVFADVDRTATLGVSIKGESWVARTIRSAWRESSTASRGCTSEFFAAGGTGILAGDGTLSYGLEKIMEAYYDFQVWKTLHGALDYQFISNPAFNRARGPVSVLGARLHWIF